MSKSQDTALRLMIVDDSPEAAEREIGAFFAPEEVVSYPPEATAWVYDQSGPTPV